MRGVIPKGGCWRRGKVVLGGENVGFCAGKVGFGEGEVAFGRGNDALEGGGAAFLEEKGCFFQAEVGFGGRLESFLRGKEAF